jgi:hypothetical protein
MQGVVSFHLKGDDTSAFVLYEAHFFDFTNRGSFQAFASAEHGISPLSQ